MPPLGTRPRRLDFDPPVLTDDAHPGLPANLRVHDNFIQLIAAVSGGALGAMIGLRHWQALEAGLAGMAAGVVVAILAASAIIHLIRRN